MKELNRKRGGFWKMLLSYSSIIISLTLFKGSPPRWFEITYPVCLGEISHYGGFRTFWRINSTWPTERDAWSGIKARTSHDYLNRCSFVNSRSTFWRMTICWLTSMNHRLVLIPKRTIRGSSKEDPNQFWEADDTGAQASFCPLIRWEDKLYVWATPQ